MDAAAFPEPMPKLPLPGQRVRWRNPRHVGILGWSEAFGSGPFEVVGVVDHAAQAIPHGVMLQTPRGRREINEVWLQLTE